jgi:hypothetical protein
MFKRQNVAFEKEFVCRTYSLKGLARMAFDLTFMSMLLQLTHYLWTMQDLRLLGINTLYDFLIILAISIVVGYKRVENRKVIKYT